jgi:hypothetical protein
MEQHKMINAELSEQELARVAGGVDVFHDAVDHFPTAGEKVIDHVTRYRAVYEKSAATAIVTGIVGGVLGGLGIHH